MEAFNNPWPFGAALYLSVLEWLLPLLPCDVCVAKLLAVVRCSLPVAGEVSAFVDLMST